MDLVTRGVQKQVPVPPADGASLHKTFSGRRGSRFGGPKKAEAHGSGNARHHLLKEDKDSRTQDSIVELFRAWDEDGDGKITRQEIARLMRFVTDNAVTDDMVDKLMLAADSNHNGSIELDEFIAWVFNSKTGEFRPDVAPSHIAAVNSPALVSALQEWFVLFDMNNNGGLEFEEYAVARLLIQPNLKSEELEDDFKVLDRDGGRTVTWPEFLKEYSRLLDAIPRPLEEKVKLVRTRAAALDKALKEVRQAKGGKDHGRLISSSTEFLAMLRKKFGSVAKAFTAIDQDSSGVLSIVELRDAVEKLLELPPGTRVALECVRVLFRELDKDMDGNFTLEELEQGPGSRRRQQPGSKDNPVPGQSLVLPQVHNLGLNSPGTGSTRSGSKGSHQSQLRTVSGDSFGSRGDSSRPGSAKKEESLPELVHTKSGRTAEKPAQGGNHRHEQRPSLGAGEKSKDSKEHRRASLPSHAHVLKMLYGSSSAGKQDAAPLAQVAKHLIDLLTTGHHQFMIRSLQHQLFEIEEAEGNNVQGKRLLKDKLAKLEKESPKDRRRFWAAECVDSSRVTFTEFEEMLQRAIQYAIALASADPRGPLLGWDAEELFKALDDNNDGAISMDEWERWEQL